MKTLWGLILVIILWNCQSSRGQRAGNQDAFEERLLQLYYPGNTTDTLKSRERLAQLRHQIRQSDLDASAKFDLWFYLNQLGQTSAFPQLPPTDGSLEDQLARFATPAEQAAISKSAALAYFRQEYLDLILSPPNRERSFYRLDPTSSLLNELTSYPFQDIESLLEIGAGDGGFGLLTQLFFEVDQHFLNEVDTLRFVSIQRQLDLLPAALSRPILVQGSHQSLGLNNEQVEAILIRNSLHHFTDPEAMLSAIKQHLLPGGQLYIFEEVRDSASGHQHCEEAMSLDEIIYLLQIEGFQLVEKQAVQSDWQQILVFEPTGPFH